MASALLGRPTDEHGDEHRDRSSSPPTGRRGSTEQQRGYGTGGDRHNNEVMSSEFSKGGFGTAPGKAGHRLSKSDGAANTFIDPVQQSGNASAQGCPPHGVKAVCGRRPRMEDAYTAFPFLVEVPVLPDACPDLIPSRIAPHVKSAGNTPPASEEGGSDGEGDSYRNNVDKRPGSTPRSSTQRQKEPLHFFGVFDGHGGAEAAAHCAQTLHQRIAEAISAATSPSSPEARESANTDSFTSAATTDQHVGEPASHRLSIDSRGESASSSSFVSLNVPAAASDREDAMRLLQEQQDNGSAGSTASDKLIEASLQDAGSLPLERSDSGCGSCGPDKFEAALTAAFNLTDEEFGKADNAALVGTTAVVALIGSRQLYVANCGTLPVWCTLLHTLLVGIERQYIVVVPGQCILFSSTGRMVHSQPCLSHSCFNNADLVATGHATCCRASLTGTCQCCQPGVLAALESFCCCCAGDSRAVLCRGDTAIALTDDHKAAREDETVSSPA